MQVGAPPPPLQLVYEHKGAKKPDYQELADQNAGEKRVLKTVGQNMQIRSFRTLKRRGLNR